MFYLFYKLFVVRFGLEGLEIMFVWVRSVYKWVMSFLFMVRCFVCSVWLFDGVENSNIFV